MEDVTNFPHLVMFTMYSSEVFSVAKRQRQVEFLISGPRQRGEEERQVLFCNWVQVVALQFPWSCHSDHTPKSEGAQKPLAFKAETMSSGLKNVKVRRLNE